jgi:hypothetical protein
MNRIASLLRTPAIAAVTLVVMAPPLAAPQQPPAPRATLHFDKTTYLSTDAIDAALIVENPGSHVLTIKVPTAQFKAVYDDGRVVGGSRAFFAWSGPQERFVATYYPDVKPGESHSVYLPVSGCPVESTPCSERITASVEVNSASGSVVLEAPEVTIDFVADPNATYRGRDIRDNRPIFVTQGSAVQHLHADKMELVFAFPAKPPPSASEQGAVDQILKRHGLSLNGYMTTGDQAGFRVAFLVGGQPSVTEAQFVIADVERQLAGRASAGAIRYVPGGYVNPQMIFTDVDADAAANARRMSQLIGSGDIARAGLADGGSKQDVQVSRPGSRPQTISDPMVWNAFYAAVSFDQPSNVDVYARSPYAYLGAREGSVLPQTLPAPIAQLEQPLQYSSDVVWEPIVATIDSDRPEIFAIGQTTGERAERFGYNSETLAELLAVRRVRSIATSLHVTAGPPTLLVSYARDPSNAQAIVAAGVALAPVGDLDRAWRVAPTPSPSPSLPPRATAIQTLVPAPTPSPTPPYGGVRAGDVLPIALPDEATRFTIRTDVPETATADQIRLSLAVTQLSSPSPSLVPSSALAEREFRSLPFVDDVAVQVSTSEPRSVGYQLVLRKADFDLPRKLADRLAALYHLPSSAVAYSIAPLANCSALAFNAQKHSLDRALHDAVEQAHTQHKTLLHLVLVAALPVHAFPAEACDLRAHGDALERASRQGPFPQIVVNAPVRLVFRLEHAPKGRR